MDINLKLEDRARGYINDNFVFDFRCGIDKIIEDMFYNLDKSSSLIVSLYKKTFYDHYGGGRISFFYEYKERDYLFLIIALNNADYLWVPDNPFYIRINNYLQERNMILT